MLVDIFLNSMYIGRTYLDIESIKLLNNSDITVVEVKNN